MTNDELKLYNSFKNATPEQQNRFTNDDWVEAERLSNLYKSENKTIQPKPKSEYAYPSTEAYNDLRVNVGEVGYSGLDPEQKKLFESQFPKSKFALAGGSFEDAIKYVDKSARQANPISAAEFTPMGGMMGAPIPMTPIGNTPMTKEVQAHPVQSAATLGSLAAPMTWPGIIAVGLGQGVGALSDKAIKGDLSTQKPSDVVTDVAGEAVKGSLAHGIGTGVGKAMESEFNPVVKAIAKYNTKLAKYPSKVAEKVAEHENKQAILNQIEREATMETAPLREIATEDEALGYLPGGTPRQRQLAGDIERISAEEESRLFVKKIQDVLGGKKKYQQLDGVVQPSEQDALEYWSKLQKPVKIPKPPVEPSGYNTLEAFPNFVQKGAELTGNAGIPVISPLARGLIDSKLVPEIGMSLVNAKVPTIVTDATLAGIRSLQDRMKKQQKAKLDEWIKWKKENLK